MALYRAKPAAAAVFYSACARAALFSGLVPGVHAAHDDDVDDGADVDRL